MIGGQRMYALCWCVRVVEPNLWRKSSPAATSHNDDLSCCHMLYKCLCMGVFLLR